MKPIFEAKNYKFLFLIAALLPAGFTVYGWGSKGHQIQARVAVAHLPMELPAFLRNSADAMSLLICEPDRWRDAEQPALDEVTGPNHTFRWEIAPKPLPANRHFFIIELAQQGKIAARTNGVRAYGTAPYGIQEWAEMLTGAFRRWRRMKERTPDEIERKRTQEQSIRFIAGVLGHWITDVSNPMHASVHVHGWDPGFPNPNGYAGKSDNLHSRYESVYVENHIELSDVNGLVDTAARVVGGWLEEAASYIATSNSYVEQIFAWDRSGRFGSGKEPKAAKAFTAARLADGARELRDIWYTAWVKSGAPMPGKKKSGS
ncbi:hypothetical protein GCM10027051_25110 [Niabella terrae]